MRRLLLVMLVLVLSTASGCSLICGDRVPASTMRAVKTNLDEILPQYRKYVEADEVASSITKKIRLQSADELEALVNEVTQGKSEGD